MSQSNKKTAKDRKPRCSARNCKECELLDDVDYACRGTGVKVTSVYKKECEKIGIQFL